MKQNLQFNTVLKFLITVGDLLIMNALFFFLYQLFDKATLGKGLTYSVPQILVLLNLVYLVCNYQNGVILYRRIVRPDHIIRKSLRNVGLLALVFTTLYALAHFGKLSVRFFLTFYLLFFVIQCVYRITVRILHSKRNDFRSSRNLDDCLHSGNRYSGIDTGTDVFSGNGYLLYSN